MVKLHNWFLAARNGSFKKHQILYYTWGITSGGNHFYSLAPGQQATQLQRNLAVAASCWRHRVQYE